MCFLICDHMNSHVRSYSIIYAPAMLKHAWAAVYGDSPVGSLLGSPRCLCYRHNQGPTIFFTLSLQRFVGLPLHLIPCTPPNSAIFVYLPSFILITWLRDLKHHWCIL